jgi:hypothetical protein
MMPKVQVNPKQEKIAACETGLVGCTHRTIVDAAKAASGGFLAT